VVVPDTLQGSVGGQIIADALQAVVDSFGTADAKAAEIKTNTSSGEVTILKLAPLSDTSGNSTSTDFQAVEVSTQQGAMSVLLPNSLLDSVEGNKMLVVTELTEIAKEALPQGSSSIGAGSTSRGILASDIFELSLASEASGTVGLAEVRDLAEPVYFRIRDTDPIEGDTCAFFDPALGAWSSAGTGLATTVPAGQDPSGTWCQTIHFSLFAVMQTIDFDGLLATGNEVGDAAGAVAVASLIICCLGFTVASGLLKRRMRRPVKGQAHIRTARGGTKRFDFTRSKLMTPTESMVSDKSRTKGQKILVQWHLNPDAVVKHIDRFDGLRRFSVDLEPAQPPMVKETSVFSTKTKSLRDVSEAILEENQPTDDWIQDSVVPLGDDGVHSMPPEELLQKLSPINVEEVAAKLDREAYETNEEVLYHSETYGRVLPAVIVGHGYFYAEGDEDEFAWPLYNCKVGVKMRDMVPMSRLRAPLDEGMVVSVMGDEQPDGTRNWTSGHILDASAWKISHLVSYPTYDVLLTDGSKIKASFDKIRRRFDQDQLVEVYMGRTFGWNYGTCANDVVEDWGGGSETSEVQTMQVVLVRDELAVTVPTFLVRSRPAITAKI